MINQARTLASLEAGRVARYHAVPTVAPQTVGLHSFGVAVLCIAFTEGKASANLLQAAILHDTAELFTGDIPFTVKRDRRDLKEAFDEMEDHVHRNFVLSMPELTPLESAILKLADTVDGLLWCRKTELAHTVRYRWEASLHLGLEKFAPLLTPELDRNIRQIAFATNILPA